MSLTYKLLVFSMLFSVAGVSYPKENPPARLHAHAGEIKGRSPVLGKVVRGVGVSIGAGVVVTSICLLAAYYSDNLAFKEVTQFPGYYY